MKRKRRWLRRIAAVLCCLMFLTAIGGYALARWGLEFLGEIGTGELSSSSHYPNLKLELATEDGTRYSRNNSGAVYSLDLETPDDLGSKIFPSYAAAAGYAHQKQAQVLPSTQALLNWCRHENQQILKQLQLGTDEWQSPFGLTARRRALRELLQALISTAEGADSPELHKAAQQAAAYIAGGLLAGGNELPAPPSEVRLAAQQRVAEFNNVPTNSKPLGFYTESAELTNLFRQDRFLAGGLSVHDAVGEPLPACAALAWTLIQTPDVAAKFTFLNKFDTAAANAPAPYTMNVERLDELRRQQDISTDDGFQRFMQDFVSAARKHGHHELAVISYAFSREEAIIIKAYGEGRLRNSAFKVIMEDVREGMIDLTPTADSGWYDYEWYALETMLIPDKAPEMSKLVVNPRYRAHLEESFKAGVASGRETHIKELRVILLGGGLGSMVPAVIRPEFVVEPTPTVFLRQASAYDFVHDALADLATDADPHQTAPLQRLAAARDLCYGIYSQLCYELGILPDIEPNERNEDQLAQAREEALAFADQLWETEAMTADARFAVPVWGDIPRTFTQCWGIGGVKLVPITSSFIEEPQVAGVEPTFKDSRWYIPVALVGEFNLPGDSALDREEWRRLCDSMEAKDLRTFMGLSREPYFGRRLGWWKHAGLAVLAMGGLAGVAFVGRTKKRRRLFIKLVFHSMLAAGAVVLLLAVTSVLSKRVRSCLFAESMVHIGSNYTNLAIEQFSRENVWSEDTIIGCFFSHIDHPNPQTRYMALFLSNYVPTFFEVMTRESMAACAEEQDGLARLMKVAETDTIPQIRQFAIALVGELATDQHLPWIIQKARHPVDGDGGLWALYYFAEREDVQELLAESIQSPDLKRFHLASIKLKQHNKHLWATSMVDAAETADELKRQRIGNRLRQMLDVPAAEITQAPTADANAQEKAERWQKLLLRIAGLSQFPTGTRALAVRRLADPEVQQEQALRLLSADSHIRNLRTRLSEKTPAERAQWLTLFERLASQTRNYREPLAEYYADDAKTEGDPLSKWTLETLLAETTPDEEPSPEKKDLPQSPFVPIVARPKRTGPDLPPLCVALGLSEAEEWEPLSHIIRVPDHDIQQYTWLLQKLFVHETGQKLALPRQE